MKMARPVAPVIVGALLIGFAAPALRADEGTGLKAGDTLGSDNWQLARELLPPEILKHYETGHYRNKIVDYPLGQPRWEKAFLAATEQNATQLDVNDVGTNYKMDRATLGGMRANPKAPFVRRRPLHGNLFDPQALARYGK